MATGHAQEGTGKADHEQELRRDSIRIGLHYENAQALEVEDQLMKRASEVVSAMKHADLVETRSFTGRGLLTIYSTPGVSFTREDRDWLEQKLTSLRSGLLAGATISSLPPENLIPHGVVVIRIGDQLEASRRSDHVSSVSRLATRIQQLEFVRQADNRGAVHRVIVNYDRQKLKEQRLDLVQLEQILKTGYAKVATDAQREDSETRTGNPSAARIMERFESLSIANETTEKDVALRDIADVAVEIETAALLDNEPVMLIPVYFTSNSDETNRRNVETLVSDTLDDSKSEVSVDFIWFDTIVGSESNGQVLALSPDFGFQGGRTVPDYMGAVCEILAEADLGEAQVMMLPRLLKTHEPPRVFVYSKSGSMSATDLTLRVRETLKRIPVLTCQPGMAEKIDDHLFARRGLELQICGDLDQVDDWTASLLEKIQQDDQFLFCEVCAVDQSRPRVELRLKDGVADRYGPQAEQKITASLPMTREFPLDANDGGKFQVKLKISDSDSFHGMEETTVWLGDERVPIHQLADLTIEHCPTYVRRLNGQTLMSIYVVPDPDSDPQLLLQKLEGYAADAAESLAIDTKDEQFRILQR